MKKKLLLGLIISGFAVLNTQSQSLAATSANQLVSATLATKQSVVAKGTSTGGTIDPDTGVLSSLAPSFTASTNKAGAQTLYLTAVAPTSGGNQQAFASSGTYLVLANITIVPAASSVTNITGGSPVATSNPNAIAFPFTPQPTKTGLTLGPWDGTNFRWPYTLAQKGDTDFDNSTSGTPLTNTYSTDDEPGTYQATVTLGFAP